MKERELQFQYEVLPSSAELETKLIPLKDEQASYIFTEQVPFSIQLKNKSPEFPLKNGHLICSHPLMFGFTRMPVFEKLGPEETIALPVTLRACLQGLNEIRFLIRYEIEQDGEDEEAPQASRFRFCRANLNVDIVYAFSITPQVSLSAKRANEHIVNIQIIDKVQPSQVYQTPEIESIQILN